MAELDKARALRIQRLSTMLSSGLDNPAAALDALVAELSVGEPQPHLWEGLHAAAAAAGKEHALSAAYKTFLAARRMKQSEPNVQAAVLLHAADFFLGILGDLETAEGYMMSSLSAVPDQPELFQRLERKYEGLSDKRRLVELYANVARKPPRPASELIGKVVNAVVPLTAATPLPDATCLGLVPLIAAGPNLLDVLEAHCKKTSRAKLACTLIEQALEAGALPESAAVEWRRKLVELYLGEANMPAKAMSHVLQLLQRDPNDVKVRPAVSRLLAIRELADEFSIELRELRRQGRGF